MPGSRYARRIRTRPAWYGERRLRSADELVGFFRRHFPENNWCFRGHADASWRLTSSLERYCLDYGFTRAEAPAVEYRLLLDFYRHAAVHAPDSPSTTD